MGVSMDIKKAVEGAMKSMEMEGFTFTEEEKALFEKVKNGELTTDDILRISDERIAKLRKEKPEIFTKEK